MGILRISRLTWVFETIVSRCLVDKRAGIGRIVDGDRLWPVMLVSQEHLTEAGRLKIKSTRRKWAFSSVLSS
jgi:hypothetical protein